MQVCFFEFGRGVAYIGKALRVGGEVFPVAEEAAPVAIEHILHFIFCMKRIPETVVVEHRSHISPGREDGFERPFDGFFEASPVDLVLHFRGKGHFFVRADKIPIFFCGVQITRNFDLGGVSASEAEVVCHADVFD